MAVLIVLYALSACLTLSVWLLAPEDRAWGVAGMVGLGALAYRRGGDHPVGSLPCRGLRRAVTRDQTRDGVVDAAHHPWVIALSTATGVAVVVELVVDSRHAR